MGADISETSRIRPFARKLLQASRRARSYPKLRFGQIDSSRPLSRASGYDRGTPVDRFYLEGFLSEHDDDIHGRVLEVGEDMYSRRFGGKRVVRQDILHIDASNPNATIVGDLGEPGILPANRFDCIILTQTLQYVFDVRAAVRQLREALRPGGTLLITVPGVAPVSLDWCDSFYWRFTEYSLEKLLAAEFSASNIAVRALGNLYSATAFLHGAAVEELSVKKLQPNMPEYAVVIVGRAVS